MATENHPSTTVWRGSRREQVADDSWQALTTDRDKLERLTVDPDFTQGLAWARNALGAETGAIVRRHALLLIQPDCLAGRKTDQCISFFAHHGFQPIHTVRVHLSPRVVGALWSHRLSDSPTLDSDTIAELVCGRSDSLLLLLRDNAPEPDTAASVRLGRLKGPARRERRTATQLRSLIGAQDRLVVLIHSPDEPADMIRESTIICGPSACELYPKMAAAVEDDAAARLATHIETLHRQTHAHDLDPYAAMNRLCAVLRDVSATPHLEATAQMLLSTLAHVRAGEGPLHWAPLAHGLRQVGIDPTQWDPVLVGSRYVKQAK
ncbi:hypothetical protein [Nocardia sp. NPDC052566]|uniref:hypothetical protein n=1 Tax=Nocardia sp. NPDC052566 TaxID=3364330 RepID=UPI0037CB93AF